MNDVKWQDNFYLHTHLSASSEILQKLLTHPSRIQELWSRAETLKHKEHRMKKFIPPAPLSEANTLLAEQMHRDLDFVRSVSEGKVDTAKAIDHIAILADSGAEEFAELKSLWHSALTADFSETYPENTDYFMFSSYNYYAGEGKELSPTLQFAVAATKLFVMGLVELRTGERNFSMSYGVQQVPMTRSRFVQALAAQICLGHAVVDDSGETPRVRVFGYLGNEIEESSDD
jgi:hypothetical protein